MNPHWGRDVVVSVPTSNFLSGCHPILVQMIMKWQLSGLWNRRCSMQTSKLIGQLYMESPLPSPFLEAARRAVCQGDQSLCDSVLSCRDCTCNIRSPLMSLMPNTMTSHFKLRIGALQTAHSFRVMWQKHCFAYEFHQLLIVSYRVTRYYIIFATVTVLGDLKPSLRIVLKGQHF